MKNLKHAIVANFTPRQWCLLENMDGAATAAHELNLELSKSFNAGLGEDAIYECVKVIMIKHCDVGAYDTEPRDFLSGVLEKLFDKEQ